MSYLQDSCTLVHSMDHPYKLEQFKDIAQKYL